MLGNVPPGRVELRVRRIGYAPLRHEAIELVPGLERIVSSRSSRCRCGSTASPSTAAPAAIAIDGADLVRRGGDLARALDGWEGVVVRRAGNGPAAPQVRGGGPDEVLVLVDGFPINDPLTGRADLSRISSREVDAVTLLPGAQTVRAGSRAVAGVILVETRRGHPSRGLHAGPAATARWAHGSADRPGALTASASAERLAGDFPYTVPDVRGGGEGDSAQCGRRAVCRLRSPTAGRSRWCCAGRSPTAVSPARRPIRRPARTARTVRSCSEPGRAGPLELSGSLQWLETRASDPAPPTGAGLRLLHSRPRRHARTRPSRAGGPARVAWVARTDRAKDAPTASEETAYGPARRLPRRHGGRRRA